MPDRLATVQLWPEWLEQHTPPGDDAAMAIRAIPHDTSAVANLPAFDGERPVVLVNLGTVVDDLELLNSAVRAVLDAGADALVTTGFTAGPGDVKGDPDRVHAVPFAPISQLLDRVTQWSQRAARALHSLRCPAACHWRSCHASPISHSRRRSSPVSAPAPSATIRLT